MDFLAYENKILCVALSGGVDSVSLLHYTIAGAKANGFSVCAAHCEHGLRGEESKADQAFVQELCAAYEIPLYCFEEDCYALAKERGESVEAAARFFRYSAFESLLAQGKADYILLAHHEDDEAETVIFRLARGTSLTGAAAMQEENGKYLRPFLSWSKAEILEYANQHNLKWREDKTNGEEIATRNKLRLRVLPALEEAVPAAKRNLARFALTSREDDECLYELAKGLVTKKTPEFLGDSGYRVQACAKKPMFTRACLLVLKELGVKVDYTKENLEELYRLQGLETGVWRQVKAGVFAVKQYGELAFFTATAEEAVAEIPFQVGVFGVGRYAVSVTKEKTGAKGELAVDGGKIPVGAVFRLKREGDAFEKFGGGTKSLKKYLVDKKIPCKVRAELPVLSFGNEALAVLTVEISQKLKITDETKEILYLSAKAKGDTNDGNS